MKLVKTFALLPFFILFLLAGAVLAADLSVPTIAVSPDIYYPFDEILYLEGRAIPNATVQIQFQKQNARPLKFNTKSDSNGEWVLAERVPLDAGYWEMRARVVEDANVTSQWSNPRVVKVIVTGITIWGVNIKFAVLVLALVAVLMLSAAIIWYFSIRITKLNARLLSKEIGEAKESVREGVSEFRRDLLDELRIFGSSGRQLSPEEFARKEHLLRELDKLERNIEHEIQDIEKELK